MANARMVGVRLEGDLESRFDAFCKKGGLTQSQGMRTLLEMGLSRGDKLDEDWLRAAFREGRLEGSRAIHSEVQKTLKDTL